MTRQKANREILKVLSTLVEQFPDQRFGQILCNYVIPEYRDKDPFFTESEITLQGVLEVLEALTPVQKEKTEQSDFSSNTLYLIQTYNNKTGKFRLFLVSSPNFGKAVTEVQNTRCTSADEILMVEKVRDVVDTDKVMEGKAYVKAYTV